MIKLVKLVFSSYGVINKHLCDNCHVIVFLRFMSIDIADLLSVYVFCPDIFRCLGSLGLHDTIVDLICAISVPFGLSKSFSSAYEFLNLLGDG